MAKLSMASDYLEGAHEKIMEKLCETNLLQTSGYGTDEYCESARDKVRKACEAPNAAVHFLVGGTQANATVIDAILRTYQGVIAADTGHINGHEAGAIELGGHKVLTIPHEDGKISAAGVKSLLEKYYGDENRDHVVMPGMVYISQPTEYGTIYSKAELTALSKVCHEYKLPLYVDGARLAYALGCKENDVTLPDLARLCDAFYIGGTKCGALFGEAVVLPNPELIPHFFTIIKQHGALLAKGRILGIMFDTLFTDDLYIKIGQTAMAAADRLRGIMAAKGFKFAINSPTNQIFVVLDKDSLEKLSAVVNYSFWEALDDGSTVIRLATSWATTMEQIDELEKSLG